MNFVGWFGLSQKSSKNKMEMLKSIILSNLALLSYN